MIYVASYRIQLRKNKWHHQVMHSITQVLLSKKKPPQLINYNTLKNSSRWLIITSSDSVRRDINQTQNWKFLKWKSKLKTFFRKYWKLKNTHSLTLNYIHHDTCFHFSLPLNLDTKQKLYAVPKSPDCQYIIQYPKEWYKQIIFIFYHDHKSLNSF